MPRSSTSTPPQFHHADLSCARLTTLLAACRKVLRVCIGPDGLLYHHWLILTVEKLAKDEAQFLRATDLSANSSNFQCMSAQSHLRAAHISTPSCARPYYSGFSLHFLQSLPWYRGELQRLCGPMSADSAVRSGSRTSHIPARHYIWQQVSVYLISSFQGKSRAARRRDRFSASERSWCRLCLSLLLTGDFRCKVRCI